MKLLLAITSISLSLAILVGCDDNPAEPPPEDNKIEYQYFTDLRDSATYRAVEIGNLTWMADNLNFEADSSMCYNNRQDSCAKYGRLYTWKTATTVCPEGWRLPDTTDFNDLLLAVGGKEVAGAKLKSKTGWYKDGNGTDEFGFLALPAGNYCVGFTNVRHGSHWWSASGGKYPGGTLYSYVLVISYEDNKADLYVYQERGWFFSVRCVRDYPPLSP